MVGSAFGSNIQLLLGSSCSVFSYKELLTKTLTVH